MLQKLTADKAFYRKLFSVMLPILVQNVITNFVSLLDNLMVGQVGTEPMSGVAIVNQLFFVFNLCIFGGLAGAGIFTAQYYGKGDQEGVRHTFRFKYFIALGAVAAFALVFFWKGELLISLFLHEGEDELDLAATLGYGKDYLKVIMIQMIPFAVAQVYSSTLRETGETVLPMKAGIVAVFVNMTFNYILIFGKLGAPALGVVGAAIATVLSRFVECAIIIVWTHRHKERNPFITGAYRSFRVPASLCRQITVMGLPLLLNEFLWSGGMTTMNQCYSLRGLEGVSAINIANTVGNLFFCAVLAMGNTVGIIIGQLLGSGKLEQAVEEDRKLIVFSLELSVAVALLMSVFSPLIPRLYNTTDTVKHLAVQLLLVNAAAMPVNAFTNAAYFTLRSGGKTVVTFLFDSAFVWVVTIPASFVLSRLTAMPILPMYILIYALDLIKCVVGYIMVKKRVWVNNLVKKNA